MPGIGMCSSDIRGHGLNPTDAEGIKRRDQTAIAHPVAADPTDNGLLQPAALPVNPFELDVVVQAIPCQLEHFIQQGDALVLKGFAEPAAGVHALQPRSPALLHQRVDSGDTF